jgi:CelD/BcsL family acetyltransferase involved in cellulose biosynthesis
MRLMAISTGEKNEFLENPANAEFFRQVIPRIARQGWLQLAFLTINDEPAATYLNFVYGDRVMVYNSGLDAERYGQLSPGIILLARLIEHAITNRYAVVDFLRGDESYKYKLGGKDTQIYTIRASKE